jgi:curved DNA-binding protein CbpA
MPEQRFRGNPYQVLEVRYDASGTVIKRRWRELAREHHPDRAAGDAEEAARLTTRMARINAAYDLLRDPARRARFDSSPDGRRARTETGFGPGPGNGLLDDEGAEAGTPSGPPPPPRTQPITARYDTTASFRPHNARLGEPARNMPGNPPLSRRDFDDQERDLRASTPTGPVERRRSRRAAPPPTLREARETILEFGRFHGYTLGEIEVLEPAYLDWVARTITRDRDLVQKARVIRADLDRRGVSQRTRQDTPGFDDRAAAG